MIKFGDMEIRNQNEAEQQFIDHIHDLIEYWHDLNGKSKKEAMCGLVHSILVALDGESGGMPPYELKPLISTPDGERWLNCGEDIAGSLHDIWACNRNDIKAGDKLSIVELEESLGITDKDKKEYPYAGENGCEDCQQGLDIDTCNEMYEEWLLERVSIL